MFKTLSIRTPSHAVFVDITSLVRDVLAESGMTDGLAIVYVPHTTAGVTINENADPDVQHDIIAALERVVPWRQSFYRHNEENSAAHIKASMMGFSQTILVRDGALVLGTWQGIYFCEFDGPRNRRVHVKIIKA